MFFLLRLKVIGRIPKIFVFCCEIIYLKTKNDKTNHSTTINYFLITSQVFFNDKQHKTVTGITNSLTLTP